MITTERKNGSKFEIGQEVKQNPDDNELIDDDDAYIPEDIKKKILKFSSKDKDLQSSDTSLTLPEENQERTIGAANLSNKIQEVPIITNEPFPSLRALVATPNQAGEAKGQIDIVITQEVLLETFKHVSTDLENELGGFLLGNRFQCPNTNRSYIIIDQYLEASYTEGTSVSLTFKEESFAQLREFLTGKFRGKELIGWYHSHPNMRIFLSPHDTHIQKSLFSRVWDVALVLDPVKNEGGFFTWSGDDAPKLYKDENRRAEFYEWLTDGAHRETVVAWSNYTVNDPKLNQKAELKEVNTGNYKQEIAVLKNENEKSSQLPVLVVDLPKKFEESVIRRIPEKYRRYILLLGLLVIVLALGSVIYSAVRFLSSPGPGSQDQIVTLNPADDQTLNENLEPVKKSLIKLELRAEKGWINQNAQKIQIILKLAGKGVEQDILENLKNHTQNVSIDGEPGEIDLDIEGNALRMAVETQLSADKIQRFRKGDSQTITVSLPFIYSGQAKKLDYPFDYLITYKKKLKSNSQDAAPILFLKGIVDKPKAPVEKAKNKDVVEAKSSQNSEGKKAGAKIDNKSDDRTANKQLKPASTNSNNKTETDRVSPKANSEKPPKAGENEQSNGRDFINEAGRLTGVDINPSQPLLLTPPVSQSKTNKTKAKKNRH